MTQPTNVMWSCKYWKTKGVERNTYTISEGQSTYACCGQRFERVGRDVFHTELEAYVAAESKARKKIESLKKDTRHTMKLADTYADCVREILKGKQ